MGGKNLFDTLNYLLVFGHTGSFSRKVHRHGFLTAVLQAHPKQATGPQRPGVHRSGVLQLPHVDQVSKKTFRYSRNVLMLFPNTKNKLYWNRFSPRSFSGHIFSGVVTFMSHIETLQSNFLKVKQPCYR